MRRLALVAAACALGGCAATVQLGAPPRFDRLATLKPGISNASDLAAALGTPQGRGAAQLTQLPVQDVWLYESTEVEGSKAHARMLIVFINKSTGVYEGHMWFASGTIYTPTR